MSFTNYICVENKKYEAVGIDISQSFGPGGNNPLAFYIEPSKHQPIVVGNFIGNIKQGGSANCDIITFCAHGNGTHTECVGHIHTLQQSINKHLPVGFYTCQYVVVEPKQIGTDMVITKDCLPTLHTNIKAIIIQTKHATIGTNYSGTNPPYFNADCLLFLANLGILHLLTNLPSVDKEDDGGLLLAHKAWFLQKNDIRTNATITELVFVPATVLETTYLLQLQVAPMETDAAPSRPLLFKAI